MSSFLGLVALILLPSFVIIPQNKNSEASEVMLRMSDKYKAYKGMAVDFTLTTQRPKLKPEESDAKYTSNDDGKLLVKGNKFKITLKGHEIICDGKNIWTYSVNEKEAQVNFYEESEQIFSPTKIFTMYKEGYAYQVKEKKNFQGKNVTVVEMTPSNKKVSFFKIDVAVDDATSNVVESKIYEKSGTRYIYKINRSNTTMILNNEEFMFDVKKHPGVNVVDLR